MSNEKKYTTNKGIPVPNDQASVTSGKGSSYTMLEDSHMLENLAHFGRERIPERVVHVKGAGPMGILKLQTIFQNIQEQNFSQKLVKNRGIC